MFGCYTEHPCPWRRRLELSHASAYAWCRLRQLVILSKNFCLWLTCHDRNSGYCSQKQGSVMRIEEIYKDPNGNKFASSISLHSLITTAPSTYPSTNMQLFKSLAAFLFVTTSLAAVIPGLDSHDHPDLSPRDLGCPGVKECQSHVRILQSLCIASGIDSLTALNSAGTRAGTTVFALTWRKSQISRYKTGTDQCRHCHCIQQ